MDQWILLKGLQGKKRVYGALDQQQEFRDLASVFKGTRRISCGNGKEMEPNAMLISAKGVVNRAPAVKLMVGSLPIW